MLAKKWPLTERPREKLIKHGPEALSDSELLAVLFVSGSGNCSAFSTGLELMNRMGSLRNIVYSTRQQICQVKGIGDTKYAQLSAASELMRRALEEPLKERAVFHRSNDVETFLKAKLRHQEAEHFCMLCLNSQHQLIAFRTMFTGTINGAAIYPRELIKQVIRDNAAAVILVHNHPSGIPEPSDADIRITNDIKSAMALIDVDVLDHFIVGDISVVSLANRGLM